MSTKTEKKNYKVLVTGFATVLVISAENESKAVEYALSEMSMGDFEMEEAKVQCEVPKEDLANARRHADCVAEDPDADDEDSED